MWDRQLGQEKGREIWGSETGSKKFKTLFGTLDDLLDRILKFGNFGTESVDRNEGSKTSYKSSKHYLEPYTSHV